jgi:hypothetical protein
LLNDKYFRHHSATEWKMNLKNGLGGGATAVKADDDCKRTPKENHPASDLQS